VLKILGDGDLTRRLKVSAHRFSQTAREKIEKAGGEVCVLGAKPVAADGNGPILVTCQGRAARRIIEDSCCTVATACAAVVERTDRDHVGETSRRFYDSGTAAKDFLTILFLAIYRVGWHIPLPVINQEVMSQTSGQDGGLGDFVDRVAVFSASNLRQATIFGLGIMPYISASIIFQLLGQCLETDRGSAQRGRNGTEEDQRVYALLDRRLVFGPELVLCQTVSDGAACGR
jgi:hypothetical protein